MAIDLGTANTLVYVDGQGIVLREPSVVAVNTSTNEVQAVGEQARQMLGRSPDTINAIRPMRDGVIANFELTERMINHFIRKAHDNRRTLVRPRVVVAVPSGITPVEKQAVRDSVEAAGARKVFLIEEPMAAAIGVDLPVQEPVGNMIVDIGGGTTEVAIISLSGVVFSKSIRVAGDEMNEAIANYVKKKYNLLIGERTAEEVKTQIGSAYPMGEEMTAEVRGRDMVAGVPKTISISGTEVREAMAEIFAVIIEAVKTTLELTPPELAADIVGRGVVVTGGGSLIRGFDTLLKKESGLPVTIAVDPLSAVALGGGKALGDPELLEKIVF